MQSLFLALPLAFAQTAPPAPEGVRLPLYFEENGGRFDPAARFVARGPGWHLYLTCDGAALALSGGARDDVAVWTRFEGAAGEPAGVGELATRVHYLRGNDPERWSTDNRTFAGVRYDGLWPGIDLVYRAAEGGGRALEYDFVVAPGADPAAIRMRFEGVERVALNGAGELVLQTLSGDLVQRAPVLYQEGPEGRSGVAGAFRLLGDGAVGFAVGRHDPARPLVIDPVLVWAGYLGGSGFETINDLRVAADGTLYAGGSTDTAPDMPVTPGVFQPASTDDVEGFVAAISGDGSTLLWCTYIGGDEATSKDGVNALALDALGRVLVAGATSATDFPTTPGSFQPTDPSAGANTNAGFVAALSSDGASLAWGTYLGGTMSGDVVYAIEVGPDGGVHAAGQARNAGFPTTPGAFQESMAVPFGGFVAALLRRRRPPLVDPARLGQRLRQRRRQRLRHRRRSPRADVVRHGRHGHQHLPGDARRVPALARERRRRRRRHAGRAPRGRRLDPRVRHLPRRERPGALDQRRPRRGRGRVRAHVDRGHVGLDGLSRDPRRRAVHQVLDERRRRRDLHRYGPRGRRGARLVDLLRRRQPGPALRRRDRRRGPRLRHRRRGEPAPHGSSLGPLRRLDLEPRLAARHLRRHGALLGSTYFGGGGYEGVGDTSNNGLLGGVRLDAGGDVYIFGNAGSPGLATAGAFQTAIVPPSPGEPAADAFIARFSQANPPAASATPRAPCFGSAPAQGLTVLAGTPAINTVFTVGIDDPLGQSGLVPPAVSTLWAVARVPAPGYPCGVPLPGYGPGGGLGELLIGVGPADLLLLSGPKSWSGPGTPSLHAVSIPCVPALNGLSLYTQGLFLKGAAAVFTGGLDLVLGA